MTLARRAYEKMQPSARDVVVLGNPQFTAQFTIPPAELRDLIAPDPLATGVFYARNGCVKELLVLGDVLSAFVLDHRGRPYSVTVRVERAGQVVRVTSRCDCSDDSGCMHAAAVLYEALRRAEPNPSPKSKSPEPRKTPKISGVPWELREWLEHIAAMPAEVNGSVPSYKWPSVMSAPEPSCVGSDVRLYVLSVDDLPKRLHLAFHVETARVLKNGDLGRKRVVRGWMLHDFLPQTASAEDKIAAQCASDLVGGRSQTVTERRRASRELLRSTVATGRCHLRVGGLTSEQPLSFGPVHRTEIQWIPFPNGKQMLGILPWGPNVRVISHDPLFYVDLATDQIGPIDVGLSAKATRVLLLGPEVAGAHVGKVREVLEGAAAGLALPTPHEHAVVEERRPQLVPTLKVRSVNGGTVLDVADFTAVYDDLVVNPKLVMETVHHADGARLLVVHRDLGAEDRARDVLTNMGFIPASWIGDGLILTFPSDDPLAWIHFIQSGLAELRACGWRVEVDPAFRHKVVDGGGTWQADVSDEGAGHWFSLDLGIDVNGERVSLLPLLVSALKRLGDVRDGRELERLAIGETVYVGLPDGRSLGLPLERVRTILTVLIELHDAGAVAGDGRMRLPRAQAAALAAVEDEAGLAFLGGAELREMAQKLKTFSGIATVPKPVGLNAVLRPYQQAGLDWLQFLREYGLAGILADDMGLGKTVQTIAHILAEKESGRLDLPCLIVGPTSTVPNWRAEIARFAPGLAVLTLHGANRADRFDEIAAADVVLTTYALLARDEETLLGREWHLVVLDEAQAIKNPTAKVTQTASRVKARHRLCLTGTPVENHLGELWSQFSFLMPGFLGDVRRFGRLFRTPIEKLGDVERQAVLRARVRPFLLRRSKAEVASDLPPKSEIIRRFDLTAGQRDLYETVRLAMNEKVRQAVAAKGLASSHIVILDALLKLRQVCCDPRLVKMDAARAVTDSAKLALLMDMLPEMIEEGRRVLLFSQFTGMLDLIKAEVEKVGIPFVELRGGTVDRAAPVARFQNGEVPLFLLSLKAGGTGINLTAADTVIHYDPWWNPAAERQATDRAHRIGQDKPVFVYKLIAAGTIEEKMLDLQERKKAVADALFDPARATGAAIEQADIDLLFQPLVME